MAPTSNMESVTAFFNAFAATPNSGQINTLVDTYFSANATLGISPGSDTKIGPPSGPQFPTPAAIKTLFNQIITSFPNATFIPVPSQAAAVYCSSSNPPMIMVQANLNTGMQQTQWFPFGSAAYSKPLSDIEPDTKQNAYVPACAVFSFNASYLITNLAIYMDRWQMAADLWPGTAPSGKKTNRPFPRP